MAAATVATPQEAPSSPPHKVLPHHAPLSTVLDASFKSTMARTFPGAVEEGQFIKACVGPLGTLGFRKGSCLPCVCVCRDEICTSFLSTVKSQYGEPFSMRGLGGLCFAGATGFGAAAAHAPDVKDGRRKYVYFFGPHIGVNGAGKLGVCNRPNIKNDSGACGALLALHSQLSQGKLATDIDHSDLEMSALKAVLAPHIEHLEGADIAELTIAAKMKIVQQLQAGIEATVDPSKCDYAVLVGVQVHGPDGINYWVPDTDCMYTMVNGERKQLVVKAPCLEEGAAVHGAVSHSQCSGDKCVIS